ncbi:MAG: EAL domain-containing protein [Acidimicrobiales bacterium]|jgi:diguanylate cyclase (GGDEF)-like protein
MEIERRLSDVLSEFARTLVTDFPIQAILDHLVVRIVDVLPVSAAGVTLIAPGADPHYIAASDDAALRFEQLQTELGEGPCIVAYQRGEAVVVPDLRADDRFPRFAPRAIEEGLGAVFTFPLRHDDRQLGALDLYRATPGLLNAGAMTAAQTLADVAAAYLLNAQARSDLRDSSDRARETALHDALTGLPNRTLLVQRLVHAILRCRRSEKLVAILFADLDRFKAINDTYGHHVGDELLVAVARRLTELLRPGDTLARLAGDEFVILCEDLDDTSQVEPLATRIDEALGEAFVLSGIEVQVSASVGIAFAGRGDDVPEQVLQDADTAMYQAKRKGGARHGTVDIGEQQLADTRAALNRDLRGALARRELRTEYQPIVATNDGRITGVEALLRWAHPVRGIVAPDTIVPLAEQSGLIIEIGRWVLMQACVDLHRWQRHDEHRELEICVNISASQLMAPDFVAVVGEVLAETRTDPKRVTLEVTESVFIQDSDRALVVLNQLKRLGVKLALDDFGTGYSSLSYLKQFPVNIVKIDRAFIADLGREPTSRLIVSAIVRLAHSLQMTVVAEGIESANQYDEVVALDCDSYQGYFFARPASAVALDSLMATAATA